MVRVLLVSRALNPPWDEASKNFARELAIASSSDVSVLVAESTTELPARVHQVPLYSAARLGWRQRIRLARLRRLQQTVDVLHLLLTPTRLNSLMFRLMLGSRRRPTVQTVASLNGREYTAREARAVFFADRVVTYSEYSRRRLERLGIASTTTIAPGIDLARFSSAPRDQGLARTLGVDPRAFVLMYPGEYTRLGATDLLVEALPRLLALSSRMHFVFGCRVKNAADAHKKVEVMNRVRDLGLADRVSYSDTIRDMPALYNLADVVVFPVLDMVGKFDVPLSVVEAMACERPVVISDLDILAEFTSDETAVQVRAGDPAGLVAAVTALHGDPARRAQLGRSARRDVMRRFDIASAAARYDELFRSLGTGSG